jgi:hypothetical protein
MLEEGVQDEDREDASFLDRQRDRQRETGRLCKPAHGKENEEGEDGERNPSPVIFARHNAPPAAGSRTMNQSGRRPTGSRASRTTSNPRLR